MSDYLTFLNVNKVENVKPSWKCLVSVKYYANHL